MINDIAIIRVTRFRKNEGEIWASLARESEHLSYNFKCFVIIFIDMRFYMKSSQNLGTFKHSPPRSKY